MPSLITELAIILILVAANGFLAMAEIAVVSSRRAKLEELQNEYGSTAVNLASDTVENPTNFLSTIQVGITLVGTLVGAFGGLTIAQKLAAVYKTIPWLATHAQTLGVGTIVILITYVMLVFGELVPKRIALSHPEKNAVRVIRFMHFFEKLAYPFVLLLSGSTRVVSRLIGVGDVDDSTVTEEEIRLMVEEGRREGVIQDQEQEMVESVFLLDDRHIDELMTPRPDIVWLDVNDTSEDIKDKIIETPMNHFPVAENSLDNMYGMVNADTLLSKYLSGEDIDLESLASKPLYVPETMAASNVLNLFKQTRQHIAIVVDEYGSVDGLVTLNDILAEVVGDIPLQENTAVQREDGSWLVDGMLSINEFKSLCSLNTVPQEDENDFHTLSGFLMAHTDEIPSAGDTIHWNRFTFEVMDMDGHHIDKVLITQEQGEDRDDTTETSR